MNETCVILESLICMPLPQCHHISLSTSSIAVSRNPQFGQLQSYLTPPRALSPNVRRDRGCLGHPPNHLEVLQPWDGGCQHLQFTRWPGNNLVAPNNENWVWIQKVPGAICQWETAPPACQRGLGLGLMDPWLKP